MNDKIIDLATYRESVDEAVSAESLKAIASQTTDPEVLLGLAFLARTGSPARPEISKMASRAEPKYAPIIALLAVTLDAINEKSVTDLIRCDPDNALGYYLQGSLLHNADNDGEALEAFRKAAHCSELRLYESVTGAALFKALDALKLADRDRLCTLSWMASRVSNFSMVGLQPLSTSLFELATLRDLAAPGEVAGLLAILAGHLFATNFNNRWFAKAALENALFGLKCKIAEAEQSAQAIGHANLTRSFVGAMLRWPGLEPTLHETKTPLTLARFLPDRISRAFGIADVCPSNIANFGEFNVSLHAPSKEAFTKVHENAANAANALINVALTDPDRILGCYLLGDAQNGAVPRQTAVEKLLVERPDLFEAAAASEEAMSPFWDLSSADPSRRNMHRMGEIGCALLNYAFAHDRTYPKSLVVLFEQKYLKPPLEAKSILTGRPYVYTAAGEKIPAKSSDGFRLVVLYDDQLTEWNTYDCVFAWGGGAILSHDLEKHLARRGK